MTITLPTCRWRGEQNAGGKFPCHLPGDRLSVSSDGVGPETCSRCYYADLDVNVEVEQKPKQQTLPSAASQVASFITEMAKWIAAGKPRCTTEQIAERKAVCDNCEFKVVLQDRQRCAKCGCNLQTTPWLFGTVETPGKLEMRTTECPEGRWKSLI